MTSKRLVTLLRELTANQYSDNVLLMWLSNCENTVLTDVLLASPEDCVELTELSDEKLIVPHPWDKLYLPYLQAQVAHANGEYDHYANYIALFNAYLEEYARHILETVQPAGGEAVTHGYYLSAYAIAVEHGYKGTVEQWLKSLIGPQGDGGKDAYTIAVENGFNGTVEQWLASMKGDAATVEIVGATALAAVDAPTVTEVEGSTPAARRYKLGIPAGARGIPGEAGRIQIVGADALAPGAAPTVTEMPGSTAQYRLYKLGIPKGDKGAKGDKGETGGTSLPIARAYVPEGPDDAYTATGDLLPTVSVANNDEQIPAVGKGLQIVFIPMIANKTESPKLRLNDGEVIPIRMRWYTNKGTDESVPEATTNVEVGSLMRGVPYTMTFCGKYWLVDSQITSPSFDNTTRGTLQSVANGFIGASGGNNFAVPINYQNGVIRNAMISTTEAEKESNSINLVSEGKAREMMPSGGGHWETVLDTVWEQDVINPTAFDSETGIFTCASGELDNLALDTEYVFFQQCAAENVAYNTILGNDNLKVTKLSETTFSIDVTPPTTFVPTNVKFSRGACLVITDIDAKKIRLTLDGQFRPTATLYDKPFFGMNVPYFGMNKGYEQIRNAYHAYQQVTAEVESPYRIVGEILCGFNAPSKNKSFHFKNNSFCCPLVPTEFSEGDINLSSDGTKIAKLYSTSTPWHLGSGYENTAITIDFLKIISGTKVKLERWVE